MRIYGDGVDQLSDWGKKGLLHGVPAGSQEKMARFDDPSSGSVNERARAWLNINCAHCHNPAGSARTCGLDLRTAQLDPAKFGVFKTPVAAGKGSGGRRYDIIPGKPDDSILMFRLETEEAGARMPSLARNIADHRANQLIREWILKLPTETATGGNRRSTSNSEFESRHVTPIAIRPAQIWLTPYSDLGMVELQADRANGPVGRLTEGPIAKPSQ